MSLFRRKLKEFVWIALLAFVGLAVAPTISRAIHLGKAGWAGGGIGHQQIAAAGSGSAAHHGHHHGTSRQPSDGLADHRHSLDHCGLCVVAAHGFALAAEPPARSAFQVAFGPAIEAVIVTPPLRDDWSPATSRGPPARA